MAKRLIDSNLFSKDWYLGLEAKYQILYIYLFTHCDVAGVYDPNLVTVSKLLNQDYSEEEVLKVFGKQIVKISDKWLITGFIKHQSGENISPKMIKPIEKALSKIGLTIEEIDTVFIRYLYRSDTTKEIEIEREIEKEYINNNYKENIELIEAPDGVNFEEKPGLFNKNNEFEQKTPAPIKKLDYFEAIARQKIPESFIEKWKLWVDICAERNDPITKSEATMQLSQLREVSIDVDIGKIIDETIKSRHKGFTFTIEKLIKEKNGNGKQDNVTVRKFAKGATSAKDINAGLDKAFGKNTTGTG